MSTPSTTSLDPTPLALPRIERLPDRLVNQIAAGEVVTRPAAALKELVENCLDAGATRIEVAVEDDALSFSVRDDGCGMDEANLRLCVERYATSKIRRIEDLQALATRGFRGEALAAISAVARLEILTRARADEAAPSDGRARDGAGNGADADNGGAGWLLRISGGKDLRITPAAAPEGTLIHVRDLFFNTPARLKFLRQAVAEWGHMLQTLLRQSLTRCDVGFAIRWRGKPYLDLPPNQPFTDRLAQILPGAAGGDLLPIDHTLHGVRVWGAVSGPRTTRRDRRHQYFFANGRPIFWRPLPFAMEEAFRGLLMTQQYPLGALLIELDGAMIDVNVHPTKEEVRFQNEGLVTGAVHRAVGEALRTANLIPTLLVPAAGTPAAGTPAAGTFPTGLVASTNGGAATAAGVAPLPGTAGPTLSPGALIAAARAAGASAATLPGGASTAAAPGERQLDFLPGFALPGAGSTAASLNTDAPAAAAAGAATRPYAEPHVRQEADLLERLRALPTPPRALAQVGLTYILAEGEPGSLLVIDQHAAHEKILYLQMMRELGAGPDGELPGMVREESLAPARTPDVQPLLVPHQIELGPSEAAALDGLLPALQAAGFDVEPFGDRTYLVQGLPVVFERLDVPAFLRDLIDDVGQGDLPRELDRLRGRICARASCRAAVKSGDRLSHAEMQRLVDQLLVTAAALRCPHGRPTTLLMTREQLDRQFGRI